MPNSSNDQDRGLWVAAVMWGIPMLMAIVVTLWGLYKNDMLSLLTLPAVYCLYLLLMSIIDRSKK